MIRLTIEIEFDDTQGELSRSVVERVMEGAIETFEDNTELAATRVRSRQEWWMT